jgi:hypothetical protein
MSEGMVLLALAAVVVVLLVVHRSEGDLARAVVEYALVGVLAVLLAATPSTAGMTAGVASGVTTGSQKGAELVGWAWRSTFGRPATAQPSATTQPARNAKDRRKERPKVAGSPTSTSRPETATESPAAPGRAVLLGVLGGLALLVLGARRLRRHDLRRAEALAMPLLAGLPFGRGRRRRRVA